MATQFIMRQIFVPFGSPHLMELPTDQVSQISIYEGKNNKYGPWYSSE